MNTRGPLRVCMVLGFRPTPGGGGTEKHVYELTAGLLRAGIEVTVASEDRPYLPDDENPLADRLLGLPPHSPSDEMWVERYIEKSRLLADLVDPSKYDVIHCHNHYGLHTALRIARTASRPKIVTTFHLTPLGSLKRFRDLALPEPEGADVDKAVAVMEEVVATLSDRCIAVSRAVAAELSGFYGIPEERVNVIENWFDPELFFPRDRKQSRNALGLADNGTYLLYVGNFQRERGKLMLASLRQLDDHVNLIAVTPDPDAAVSAEFGQRVLFPGYVPPQMMPLYYSAVDLQCFPTLYGGFGLVLIESMACGCATVVFDYPAMNEIISQETGFLVAEPTAAAFASTIETGLREAGSKRDAAIHRARRYHRHAQIEKVLDLYLGVTRGFISD